eukprot:7969606-Alexandrium_andersonii.AAC.1
MGTMRVEADTMEWSKISLEMKFRTSRWSGKGLRLPYASPIPQSPRHCFRRRTGRPKANRFRVNDRRDDQAQ